MEGNGTETKYMLNSAIYGQNRPSPETEPMQSENMTRTSAAGAFYSCKENHQVFFVCLFFY